LDLIVYKINSFPLKSETFVVNQIITGIILGYRVNVFVNELLPLENSSQFDLFSKYGIDKLIIEKTTFRKVSPIKKLFRILRLVILKEAPWYWLKTFNYFKYGLRGLKGRTFEKLYENRFVLNADLIHIQFGLAKDDIDLLKSYGFIKGRVITTFHGYDAHFNKSNLIQKKFYYKNLFTVGDFFTANTNYLYDQLITLGCDKGKIEVIPMTVDTEYFYPIKKHQNKRIRIISVGRLITFKGHSYGISALKLLVDNGYDIEYTIIGDGPELENLTAKTRALNLQNIVDFKGVCNQSEILKNLQHSDIFLMTSTADYSGRRETQGLVTAEAQACGLPVVAFASGGVPYTILDGVTGFLVDENNINAMASKVEELIVSPELRSQMGLNAREFCVNNFSNQFGLLKWKEIYSNLL